MLLLLQSKRQKEVKMQVFSKDLPICCYAEKEVDVLLNGRMQSVENGTAEFVSHKEAKAHIKALFT